MQGLDPSQTEEDLPVTGGVTAQSRELREKEDEAGHDRLSEVGRVELDHIGGEAQKLSHHNVTTFPTLSAQGGEVPPTLLCG